MKMASQRFCLRWNNHQSNLLSVFDQLLHAETFTDVTLAVDGQYLKAHKMVLSACSPYFNSLFVNHPEKHPIVILKDVPYSDMKSLLDFMYRGEVSVDQERLTAFLRVAESLRIKGLTEVNDDKPSGVTPTPPPPPPQLQRIQPYLVQQQQQQQQQQQRGKGQGLLSSNNNNNNSSSSSTNLAQTQQLQQQQSLLSTALAAMPKRKRGRPRKLSGSSNGTGNDYDEYEREGMLNDSELNESKLGNDSFSGNDDASDDNQRESCDNDQDLNESRDSMSQPKKVKQSKDTRPQQQQQQAQSNDNDNNSTSDPNDSDCDDQMDTSYMEPQLMLDEYDEPVEFKFDPNSSPSSQENASANLTQQARQQALLLAAQQTHKQQLVEAAAAAAAAAGGLKMAAVVGTGSIPGTVTLMNSMVGIPKLTPITKSNKPKVNKRGKLKQNGIGGAGSDTKPFNNDFIDIFSGNYIGSAQTQAKLKGALSGSAGNLNIASPTSKTKLNTSSGAGDGETEGSVRDYCTKEVQLINASPELSQRLFGSSKTTATTTATIGTLVQRQVQPQQPLQQAKGTPDGQEAPIHLPTVLGLKIRVNAQIQQQSNSSANSLLKQQLRSGLKEPEVSRIGSNNSCSNNNSSAHNNDANGHEAYDDLSSNNDSCSALQSLANAAERQAAKASANAIKPPSANNLHHQFLMHMAANPILKSGGDFFQKQQQQPNKPPETELNSPSSLIERSAEASSKTESELPAPADERRGGQVLVFKSPQRSARGGDRAKNPAKRKGSNGGSARPVQRRRIRRKAQSTLDDQAEHLTEMSVRGLDLFRYASITEGVYQCTECAKENVQKTFKNKYSFQRHAFLYHEGKHRKVFPCPVCGKEFSRPDKMKNHLKMTHESFVSKQDMSTFHPLNYLISAAAAGEIHSSLFSPPQHQQMQQQLDAESDGVGEGLTGSAGTSLGINLQMQKQSADMLELATPADALLKLHNELIIKDEYISPSPSPSPPPTTEAPDFRSPTVVVTQPPTQRLEEVK